MLKFQYTCERHQKIFIAVLESRGCTDRAKMDEIRKRLLAWLSAKYPRAVLDHFNDECCLGCLLETDFVDMEAIYARLADMANE
jgi:hypothetical protein